MSEDGRLIAMLTGAGFTLLVFLIVCVTFFDCVSTGREDTIQKCIKESPVESCKWLLEKP